MARDFFPRRDVEALAFTANFRRHIVEDAVILQLPPEVVSGYVELQEEFTQALRASLSPSSNSSASTERKRMVRKAIEAATRSVAGRIRASSSTLPPGMITALGLKVRRKPRLTQRPTVAPRVRIGEVVGRRVTVMLIDAESDKRRILPTAKGAAIFTHVGNEPAPRLEQWDYRFSTTRSKLTVDFPVSLPPGTKVWVCAQWQSPRGERGPHSIPVSARMAYGSTHLPILHAA